MADCIIYCGSRTFHRGDVGRIRHGAAARGDDLIGDLLRHAYIGSASLHVATEVADDDVRTLAPEQQRHGPADTATAAGDNRNLAFETSCHHVTWLSKGLNSATR
jgi:hypothetical protein